MDNAENNSDEGEEKNNRKDLLKLQKLLKEDFLINKEGKKADLKKVSIEESTRNDHLNEVATYIIQSGNKESSRIKKLLDPLND
jgi:hypothetical protein